MGDLVKNTYKPVSVSAKSEHGDATVELDLSVTEEQDAIGGGHLEIAPRKYRVLTDNYTAGKQGDVVELALLKEIEAALVSGGHVERYDEPAKEDKKPATKAADKKEQ